MSVGAIGTGTETAMPRDAVLGAVGAALAGVETPVLAGAPPPARPTDDSTALVARFGVAARAVGTIVHEVSDGAAAAALLRGILEAASATRVAVAPSPLARSVTAAAAAALRGVVVDVVDEATATDAVASAEVGVTEADALVAASGTLVLRSGGCPRSVSLLPATHVAIVPRARLVAELGTALAMLRAAGGRPDTCITLITGPSRTADIEKKLVVGVHGPCALHVVLVADSAV